MQTQLEDNYAKLNAAHLEISEEFTAKYAPTPARLI